MPDVEAVSVSPTRAVPSIVGAPSAGAFAGGGPATIAAAPADSCRPSAVHTAPASAQSRSGGSEIPISPAPDGVTSMLHRSARPSTRAAPVTVPPVTVSASSRMAAALTATSSLNSIRNRNAVSPSCSDGSPSNSAVSGSAVVAGSPATPSTGSDSGPTAACLRSASRSVAALRIVPPRRSIAPDSSPTSTPSASRSPRCTS